MNDKNKIGAVIVTYNRRDKLEKALECFSQQIEKPEYIIVVDNASSDGTDKLLNEWILKEEGFEKKIISQKTNTGGSGGFYTGLEASLRMNANWVWVSDDDAFPEKDVFQIIKGYLDTHNTIDISSVCTAVINHGEIDLAHRARYIIQGADVKVEYVGKEEYDKNEFDLNAFSYVGAVINVSKMMEVGTTKKDFFIWCDDTEHSIRLSKVGRIICLPKAKVVHNQESSKNDSKVITWKNYYGIRNNCVMFNEDFPAVCSRKYKWTRYNILIKLGIKAYILKSCSKEYFKMYYCAVRDAYKNKLGIHPKYKPGWKLDV